MAADLPLRAQRSQRNTGITEKISAFLAYAAVNIGQDPDQTYQSVDDSLIGVQKIPYPISGAAFVRWEMVIPGPDDTYSMVVHGWSVPNEPLPYTLHYWEVPLASGGSLSVEATPAS